MSISFVNPRLARLAALVCLLAALPGLRAQAQSGIQAGDSVVVRVEPLSQVAKKPLLLDVSVYAAAWNGAAGRGIAASSATSQTLYGNYIDVGLGAEVYKSGLWRLGGSLGYKYDRFAYDASLLGGTGVHTHWLSTDVCATMSFLEAGLKSDLFLGSHLDDRAQTTYGGIYSDSFNPVTLAWYVGMNFSISKLKLEMRVGTHIKHPLNIEKLAYYNLRNSTATGLFLEARASYRIFTNGKAFSSRSTLGTLVNSWMDF